MFFAMTQLFKNGQHSTLVKDLYVYRTSMWQMEPCGALPRWQTASPAEHRTLPLSHSTASSLTSLPALLV